MDVAATAVDALLMVEPRQRSGTASLRITCCLCDKPIARSSDIFALDAEWQRRFPRMTGALACRTCALNTEWRCRTATDDEFVEGHIPAGGQESEWDIDGWSHIEAHGTHTAMVISYPWSGLLQGGEDYLRRALRRPQLDPDVARRLRDTLDRWDSRASTVTMPR